MVWRQTLGRWGETVAADFLAGKGYRLLARNARTAYGEIDLVMLDGDLVVFVEVKTRRSTSYGLPEAALTAQKRAHLLASAQAYLQEHPDAGDNWRIDVIAIYQAGKDHRPEITHFINAFNE